MGDADGVKITGKVEVNVLHGNNLGVTTTGSPALHAEARAQRRFADANCRFLANGVEGIAKADGGCCLAFTGRRRRDCGDQNQLPFRPIFQGTDEFKRNLGFGGAEVMQVFDRDIQLGADIRNRLHRSLAGYFNIAQYPSPCV